MVVLKTRELVKIENLEKQLAEMQDELNKLKQVNVEKPKKWKPKKGQQYFYLGGMGEIHACLWTDSHGDDLRYLLNNVFRTENDAIECQKKIKFQARFKNFVEERTEELDWGNDNQFKYYLYYNHVDKKISIASAWVCKTQGVIYASLERILRDAVKEIGEENIKKYVLEVKE